MNAYRANGGYSGMEYDRWVEQRSGDTTEKSAMTKIQQQFWVTKQSVYRKLGKKEDECIVASDAELDAKLELFRSIQESCHDLQRIIDKYQERLCTLAQEENAMGRFLKEAGKSDKTRAGKMMTAVGKSLSYSGQQRLALRTPLLRLHQEVDTFRHRAIDDTLGNVRSMEKMRVEYRASLNWMKNVSTELDPDAFTQLDKFRKVQGQVRRNKAKFDQLKLDCLQKIDLLTAARCNMFSHALILYQNSLIQFAEKTTRTFATITNSFKGYQHYEFCVVKELSEAQSHAEQAAEQAAGQAAGQAAVQTTEQTAEQEIDTDKLLFFDSDYQDEPDLPPPSAAAAPAAPAASSSLDAPLLDLSLDDNEQKAKEPPTSGGYRGNESSTSVNSDLDFLDFQSGADEMALLAEILNTDSCPPPTLEPSPGHAGGGGGGFLPSHLLDLALLAPAPAAAATAPAAAAAAAAPARHAWLDLFADLGPLADLADPDAANVDRNC